MAAREYQVVVGGELSDDAAPAFKGMRLERREGTTILVGRIRDQAENVPKPMVTMPRLRTLAKLAASAGPMLVLRLGAWG